tara:strand:- start:5080 stop:6252 length:1173 start_codon:yes stop_codon:yes gene_type:complete
MTIVHKGFDGLDVAFRTNISKELYDMLSGAKERAIEEHEPQLIEWNGVEMHVQSSGAQGYQFRCDTGPLGATWFIKKPNVKDEWGIRVSCKSLPLAVRGLGRVRDDLHAFLDAIAGPVTVRDVSIGRVDYAVDILAPQFELCSDNFVMHSSSKRTEFKDIETHGTSGRTTGVRIGSMPFRQLAVYDKRADIITKRKVEWWKIYNANLQAMGKPSLAPKDPEKSRVWRFELRVGKCHLKDKWNLRTWEDLDNLLADVMRKLSEAIRYARPTQDSNRSRWPDDPLWAQVKDEIANDLAEMASGIEPGVIKEIRRDELASLLLGQIVGLSATLSVLTDGDGEEQRDLPDLVARGIERAQRFDRMEFERKRSKAKARYRFIDQIDTASAAEISG